MILNDILFFLLQSEEDRQLQEELNLCVERLVVCFFFLY